MKLHETIELMSSSDYKDRLKAEYWQVKIRYDALIKFLYPANGVREKELSFDQLELLMKQSFYMYEYMIALSKRAEIEGIDLYA